MAAGLIAGLAILLAHLGTGDSGKRAALADGSERAAEGVREYLLGHFEERRGRHRQAFEAFERAFGQPLLGARARCRAAWNALRAGETEAAWRWVEELLVLSQPEPELRDEILELAARLAVPARRELPPRRWKGSPAGERWWRWAEIRNRAERPHPSSRDLLAALAFVSQRPEDLLSLDLAASWKEDAWRQGDTALDAAWGRVFMAHRELSEAVRFLERARANAAPGGSAGVVFRELGYLAARARFFLGDHRGAARAFEELARPEAAPEQRADALHQRARSLELAGDLEAALAAFAQAASVSPAGEWAGASLAGVIRLARRLSRHALAEREFERLAGLPNARPLAARTAVGWAAGRICAGDAAGADPLLDRALRWGHDPAEVAYWRGRAAELRGEATIALERYLDAAAAGGWNPWAAAAAKRVPSGFGETLPVALERRLAAARNPELASWEAWFGETVPSLRRASAAARERLRASPEARLFLEGGSREPGLQGPPGTTEELLLALGLVGEIPDSWLERRFRTAPAAVRLGLARQLGSEGRIRSSVRWVERVVQGRPAELPLEWFHASILELLYPMPFRPLLDSAARGFGVEEALLVALLREESRFDPAARSGAGARGLGQFLLSTARGVSQRNGLPVPGLWDLEEPSVSIPLAAAHLRELLEAFDSQVEAALAAYNAGEIQARAWLEALGCSEPEAYRSQIGFRETRRYVQRILESREAYRRLGIQAGSSAAPCPGPGAGCNFSVNVLP